jgi:uncharacterized protein YifN (PemK superfamily)
MALPDPVPGLVIRYAYLWHDQHRRGLEEGVKDRPCVVVFAIRHQNKRALVTVAPITHRQPAKDAKAVEIPAETKARLGLDEARSWIVTDELNEFYWPGPDIRPVRTQQFSYGLIPRGLFERMRSSIVEHLNAHGLKVSRRT